MRLMMCLLGLRPVEEPPGVARARNHWSFSPALRHRPHAPPPKGAESLLWVIRDMHVDPFPGTPSPWVPGGQLCFSPFPVQGSQLASFLGVKKNNAGSMG